MSEHMMQGLTSVVSVLIKWGYETSRLTADSGGTLWAALSDLSE